jgi:uncharacterized protein
MNYIQIDFNLQKIFIYFNNSEFMTKFTLITGASSGIGKALAHVYAENKRNLIIVSRNLNELESLAIQLKEKHQIEVIFLAKDLSKQDNCLSLFTYIENHNLIVSEFINNAGIGFHGKFEDTAVENDLSMIDLNITALVTLSKLYVNYAKKIKNTRLVQLASIASFFPGPYMSVYYASKAFVLSFSKALHAELDSEICQVSVVCPGPTPTKFQENAHMIISDLTIKLGLITSAEFVAQKIFDQVQKGKFLIVPGMMNKLNQLLSPVIPNFISNKMIIRSHYGK